MVQQRPTGVTILAIWFFLSGISTFLSGLGTMFIPLPSTFATFTLGFGIFGVLVGALYFAIGWGLWEGMNWARITAIVLSVIGMISSLFGGVALLIGVNVGGITLNFPGVGAGLIILALIEGLIIYYLMRSDVEVYFTGGAYGPPIMEATITSAPPPTPVVTAPPPVTISPPQPRVPPTEVWPPQQPPAAWLVARGGPRAGKQFGLQRGHNTIGRDGTQCDIVLDDTTVSKRHAELRYENGQFVLFDLASTNGTFVNDRRIQRQGLLDGDDVRIGNVPFVFKEVKTR